MNTALPTSFPILSSGVVTLTNQFGMEINQQLNAPSQRAEARQHPTVERQQGSLLPVLNSQEGITVEGSQHPNPGFFLIPQTGFNLNSGILIPCVKVTQKSIAMPKSYTHSFGNTPLFVNPGIQNIATAVTNLAQIGTQNNGMGSLSTVTSSSYVGNQNVTILPSVAAGGKISDSSDTHENEPKHDKEETSGEKEFFCSVCNVDCGSLELFDEHKSEKTFICRVCTVIFNNHQELENHFFNHRKYTCDVCKKAFRVKADLLCHKNTVLTCNKPGRHRCKICDNKFVHKIRLETHMEKEHPNAEPRMLPCLICKRQFKNLGQISHHMRTEHTAYENVVCDICQKIAIGPEKLKRHIKQVHLPSSECCPICKKTFASKYSFKDHMEKHNGEEVACDICGTLARGKKALSYHMRCHQSRIFPCKICNMTFNGKSEIATHNKKVHKKGLLQPAICEVCGKVLKTMDVLKLHMVTHSDEKPYVCEVCGAAFKTKVALKTHGRIHSDLRKYSCNRCGEGFRWKQTFDKHVLKCESSQNEDTSTVAESE